MGIGRNSFRSFRHKNKGVALGRLTVPRRKYSPSRRLLEFLRYFEGLDQGLENGIAGCSPSNCC